MARIEVVLPEFAEGAKSIKLRQWLVEVGEAVKKDDEIAECATDKLQIYIEAPEGGIVKELLAEEGDKIEVGQLIAVIEG